MSSLVGKDTELDATGSACTLVAPLLCDLICCSLTVVVIKAAANPRLFIKFLNPFSFSPSLEPQSPLY